MKRFLKLLMGLGGVAGVCLLPVKEVSAGMVGAPEGQFESEKASPIDLRRLKVGIEGDWVFNKGMKVADRQSEKVLLSRTYRARMGYRFWDPFELYGLVGAADIELESLDSTGDRIRDDYTYGTQVGGGLKAHFKLPDQWWNLLVTLDGQFTYWESDVQSSGGSRSGPEVNSRGEIIARQYHSALTVGRTYSFGGWQFLPYVGGRWSQLLLNENDRDSDNLVIPKASWRADDNIGVIAGASLARGEHWQATVEGRFVDETAVSTSVRFRF